MPAQNSNPPDAAAANEPLPKAYDPLAIEEKWARRWVEEKLFHVETPAPGSDKKPFTILLPPPNVTGRLHMGHMFEQTETDILIRWHRMKGDLAMWVPGTDHAGIATQMLVERQLATENLSREGLGRDAFIERVWKWKDHYGGAILDQMKRLGASVDWQREYFTMDERLSVAVREAFVRLYEQGLMYRGAYIVNWCPRCQTALSDLEVVHSEHAGKLWHIRYATTDGTDSIVIATTRPETMLGDVAVAVNPKDERYAALHGKKLRLPLLGREIPLVQDDWANPEFGTGAVKVTPAHDPNDFAIGQRHQLPSINVMDTRGIINENGGPYAGLDRYAARKRILEDLEAQGLLVAAKDHTYALGRCDRCKTVVEPRLSTQWFIAVNKVATGAHAPSDGLTLQQRAIAAVKENYVKIGPDQHRKVYLEWMNNLHDWCISRQLWWGHRIPAWHCAACGKITVARDTPAACQHCGSANLQQEMDVLDTWFSSGLLPFTVFGWPKATPDLAAFYPTQLLVTGFDILFFWVARMILLGTHFMLPEPMPNGQTRELKDAVPFREVHIHALVRDADRQKMSKTKGNVIDPIEIITRYGTDAVRFTLASMASPGTDIAFSEARTEGYRAFANKIWNAARFIFMQRDRASEAGIKINARHPEGFSPKDPSQVPVTLEDRWITSRLSQTITAVNDSLADYRFDHAADAAYQFFWGDFCDWYLEIVKIRLEYDTEDQKKQAAASLETLLVTFESALRLLSPFMPFITEELWQALTNQMSFRPESAAADGVEEPAVASIALINFPVEKELDHRAMHEMNQLQDVVTSTRRNRKLKSVPDKEFVPVAIRINAALGGYLNGGLNNDFRKLYCYLAKASAIDFTSDLAGEGPVDVTVHYEVPIDLPAEHARLTKDLAAQEKEFANNQRQLGNENFLAKAPTNVVEGLRTRAAELTVLLEKNRAALAALDAKV
jgi:valyl-tRNA synthetase